MKICQRYLKAWPGTEGEPANVVPAFTSRRTTKSCPVERGGFSITVDISKW